MLQKKKKIEFLIENIWRNTDNTDFTVETGPSRKIKLNIYLILYNFKLCN